jgi:Mg/Co/Ni transporter MgtE
MNGVTRMSNAAKLNVTGIVLALPVCCSRSSRDRNSIPRFAGPIVLLAVAVIVAFVRRRWTAYVGLLVPLVLGVGAIIAAVMTGEFVAQLTDVGRAGVFVGSVMHVVGLVAAVAGGVGMLLRPRGAGEHER